MQSVSRRNLLTGTAALALAGVPVAVEAVSGEDPAVIAADRARALFDLSTELYSAHENLDRKPSAAERKSYLAASQRARDQWDEAMAELAATPASSPRGIIAKLRWTEEALDFGETAHDPDILASAIRDLERMGGAA